MRDELQREQKGENCTHKIIARLSKMAFLGEQVSPLIKGIVPLRNCMSKARTTITMHQHRFLIKAVLLKDMDRVFANLNNLRFPQRQ